jgi:hypothetical protein
MRLRVSLYVGNLTIARAPSEILTMRSRNCSRIQVTTAIRIARTQRGAGVKHAAFGSTYEGESSDMFSRQRAAVLQETLTATTAITSGCLKVEKKAEHEKCYIPTWSQHITLKNNHISSHAAWLARRLVGGPQPAAMCIIVGVSTLVSSIAPVCKLRNDSRAETKPGLSTL